MPFSNSQNYCSPKRKTPEILRSRGFFRKFADESPWADVLKTLFLPVFAVLIRWALRRDDIKCGHSIHDSRNGMVPEFPAWWQNSVYPLQTIVPSVWEMPKHDRMPPQLPDSKSWNTAWSALFLQAVSQKDFPQSFVLLHPEVRQGSGLPPLTHLKRQKKDRR